MLKSRMLGTVLACARDESVYPSVAVDAALATLRGPAILTTFTPTPTPSALWAT